TKLSLTLDPDPAISGGVLRMQSVRVSVSDYTGQQIGLHLNGELLTYLTLSEGEGASYLIPTSLMLTDAENVLQAVYLMEHSEAVDSDEMRWMVDAQLDELEVESLQEGMTVFEVKTEAGARVTVWLNGEIVEECTADEQGKATIQFKEPLAVTDSLSIEAQDRVGNRGSIAPGIEKKPIVAPTLRFADTEEAQMTVGNRVLFLEGTAEPGLEMTLSVGGIHQASIAADGQGNWRYALDTAGLTDGKQKRIQLEYVDEIGAAEYLYLTVDKDAGVIDIQGTVDDETEYLTGTAKPGTRLSVTYADGQKQTAQVSEDGAFSIPLNALQAGTVLRLETEDELGNTAELDVTVKAAPRQELAMDEPPYGQTVIVTPRSEALECRGTGHHGKAVWVSNGEQTQEIAVRDDGSWEARIELPDMEDGETAAFTFAYADGEGSTLQMEILCDGYCEAPVLDEEIIYEDMTSIGLRTEPNAAVYLNELCVGQADRAGEIEVPLSALSEGARLVFYAVDPWGNDSEKAEYEVRKRLAVYGGYLSRPDREQYNAGEEIDVLAYLVYTQGHSISGRVEVTDSQSGERVISSSVADLLSAEQLENRRKDERLTGIQVDEGVSKRFRLTTDSGLTAGHDYSVMLYASVDQGDERVIDSRTFTYGAETETGNVKPYERYDETAPYAASLDISDEAYNAGSVFLTGSFYAPVGTSLSVLSVTVDGTQLASRAISMDRLRRSDGQAVFVQQLTDDVDIERGGFVIRLNAGNVKDGTHEVVLSLSSSNSLEAITFASLTVHTDSSQKTVTMKNFQKALAEKW
ncbi:MAG: Ig-like domain-containing protein, partial [Clostridia bacterium]|nr:Ig-like domain-containing protein [Clostridia bacterium]